MLAQVGERHQRRRRDDQREHGRKAEPEDDGGGEIDPPLRRRRAERDLAREEFDVHAECDRQHAQDRGHGGEHDRARALAAGLDDGVVGGHAFAPQSIIGIDQHDVVVHDHARVRDDADAGHHHAEGLPHDQ